MMLFERRVPVASLIGCLGLLLSVGPAGHAQTSTAVTVNATSSLGVIPATAFGINTAIWDGNLLDAAVINSVSSVGITAMRYPGGSTADDYNWQTNSVVPGQNSYANPNNGFDAFVSLAKKAGTTPILTVNYGSNATGNGGGTPAFAASWVQYANITHGYGIKYWEIGNEVYGNGEYGSSWETDLHAAHDPTTYGSNVVQFAAAMKAVDPTIKIGAVLTAPGNWPDGQSPDWNSNVLARCGSVIDFVIVHWYPESPGSETDQGLLAAPQNGFAGSPGIIAMTAKLRSLISQYGGKNASSIQIMVTETNSVAYNPGKQTVSIVNAMFAADTLLTWVENGVANVDVWDLHNGSVGGNVSSSLYGSATYGDYGILSAGNSGEPAADTPFPTYYGIGMLSILGRPGDRLIGAISTSSLLSAHAALQADGNLALLLINKDPSNATSAAVSVSGYIPAASGTAYRYGAAGGAISSATLTGLGSSFTVATAPYSLTTVLLTPAMSPIATPSFSLTASPASLSVTQGATGSSTITVAPSGGFKGSVTFTALGVPSGITASFSPSSAAGSTSLMLTAGSSAVPASSAITITGTSGSLHASTNVALVVSAAATSGFSLSASPASLSVMQGGSATSTINVTPSDGFANAVALAATGLPSGISASFSPASTQSTSTLTLSAGSAATQGTSMLTISGIGGASSSTVTLPLTVIGQAPIGGSATFTGQASSNGPWFDEDDVVLSAPASITALTLTITVPAANVTYNGSYDTVGSQIIDSHSGSTNLVYVYTLTAGQVIWSGQYKFAAQMNGNGTTHGFAGDSWSVTYSSGGSTYTQSGKI